MFFKGVETTNQIYLLLFFSAQILQLPASPFVWFPVFLTHGFTPSWMFGDMDLKPSKLNMVCPHKFQQKWPKNHPESLWSLDPQKHGLEKGLSFFNYRDFLGVHVGFLGSKFSFLRYVRHVFDLKKSGHPLQSPVPRPVSLASWDSKSERRRWGSGVMSLQDVLIGVYLKCLELEIVCIQECKYFFLGFSRLDVNQIHGTLRWNHIAWRFKEKTSSYKGW